MLNSFEQALNFIISNGITNDFKSRLNTICNETNEQKWANTTDFITKMELLNS
jgi:hypothetical protein